MADLDLEAIEKRLQRYEETPARHATKIEISAAREEAMKIADFFDGAPRDIAALCAEVRRLRAEVASLRTARN